MDHAHEVDVLVAGGGAGGLGAAVAAARLGCSVLLVERADTLGGTMIRGGVHCWEMGVGGTGVPLDIYRRLRRIEGAVGIYSFGRHACWPESNLPPFPGGESLIDPARRYIDTLRRHGARSIHADEAFVREYWHGVVFEPEAMLRVVAAMLAETGRCTVRTSVAVERAEVASGRVVAVGLSDGTMVRPCVAVDCTGDAVLCELAGAELMTGQEGRDRFGEPSAPERATDRRNAATLIYRVRPKQRECVDALPEGIPSNCWWRDRFPVASINQYPCGDLNVNMLPTMEGAEIAAMEPVEALSECTHRVLAHWHFLQSTIPEFRRFELCWIAPEVGRRESRRVASETILTEHDLLAGLSGQAHDDIIALADHSRDVHGAGGSGGELRQPYGVPYRCLVPKGFGNLLVACRSAGFSAIAASSCRLSRTMMQLGQAAGTAAWLSKRWGVDPASVRPGELRESLREQGVELDWPRPERFRRAIEKVEDER